MEGPPQDIKIFPPETTSFPQTAILSVPQGSPNSLQEASSTGRGKGTPSVTAAAATYPKARAGKHESSTQDNIIAQSFQAAQSVPMVVHVAPVPPIPNHLPTTSTSFFAVPNFHHPAKYPGTKDDTMVSDLIEKFTCMPIEYQLLSIQAKRVQNMVASARRTRSHRKFPLSQ